MANLLTGDDASFTSSAGLWAEYLSAANFTGAWSSDEGGVLKYTVTGGTPATLGMASTNGPSLNKIPVTPGETLTLSINVKQTAGSFRTVRLEAQWYEADETTTPGSDQAPESVTTTTGSWQTISGNVTVPEGVAYMRLRAPVVNAVTPDVIIWDDASVELAAVGFDDLYVLDVYTGLALERCHVQYYDGADLIRQTIAPSDLPPPPVPPLFWPDDFGYVNVKDDYGAVGDGVTDDTDAIEAALLANDYLDAGSNPHLDRSAPRTVYFPQGEYLVTRELIFPGSSVRILGQGELYTVIKLADNLALFQTGTRYLLRTGNAGTAGQENAGFANYLAHITLDVGAGNPAAVGCRYSVANSGSMRHVTIRSSDPAYVGKYGILFGTTAGPGLCSDVTIEGFDYGIRTEGNAVNDIVFGNTLTLRNQVVVGIQHNSKSLAIEHLVTESVPLVADVTNARAAMTIARATLDGTESGPAFTLVASAYLWLRDVTASGHANLITQAGVTRFSGASSITEWASANYRRGNTSTAWTESGPYVSLNLPIETAPEFHDPVEANWTSPQAHGYPGVDLGTALEDAIASGATTIYFPHAAYTLNTDITLTGSVHKIDFGFSTITGSGSITVGDTDAGECIIENVCPSSMQVIHNSSGTTVYRDVGNKNGHAVPFVTTGASATGDLFIESVGAHANMSITRPINVWARQLNRERAVLSISGGATVWILGDNVEDQSGDTPDVDVTGASLLEVCGGAHDVLAHTAYPSGGRAAIEVSGGSSVSIVQPGMMRQTGAVGLWVDDASGGGMTGDQAYHATSGLNDDRVVASYVSP